MLYSITEINFELYPISTLDPVGSQKGRLVQLNADSDAAEELLRPVPVAYVCSLDRQMSIALILIDMIQSVVGGPHGHAVLFPCSTLSTFQTFPSGTAEIELSNNTWLN
jgi:hypothetical protein